MKDAMGDIINKKVVFTDEEFRRYFGRCTSFARSYVHDLNDAENIAADALTTYIQKCSEEEKVEHVLPYLLSIVRNKALHYLRHKCHEYQMQSDVKESLKFELDLRINALESCDPHVLYQSDIQAILRESMAVMGEKTSAVFKLSRFEGKSHKEIAKELGMTEKSIEYHITKALRRLREDLKDYLPLIAVFLGL